MIFDKVVYHDDIAYLVVREVKKHCTEDVKEGKAGTYVKIWKDFLGVDKVLQKPDCFLFVNKIEEPEYEMLTNNKKS